MDKPKFKVGDIVYGKTIDLMEVYSKNPKRNSGAMGEVKNAIESGGRWVYQLKGTILFLLEEDIIKY